MGFRRRVDHSDAAHDADKNTFRIFIPPKVVGVGFRTQRDALAKSIRLAIINFDHAASRVGYKDSVESGDVEDTLRFVQSLDTLNDFGLKGVDDLHRIVAQSGKNQEPALGEFREMIDTTGNAWHRYLLNEQHRRKFAGHRLRRRACTLRVSHHEQTQST